MHNRVIPALLCAAAIAFACGPRAHGAAQSLTARAPSRGKTRASATQAPVLTTTLDARVGDGVAFTLGVTNSWPQGVELTFPSGQTHDFAVFDAAGREVWRWSAERMFTQALQNKQLASGETVSYGGRLPAGQPAGEYMVVATLRSSTHPAEQRARFKLP